MKKHTKRLAICCSIIALGYPVSVLAAPDEASSAESSVTLHTSRQERIQETDELLCGVINERRARENAEALTVSDTLMERAAELVTKYDGNNGAADAGILDTEHGCVTVIRGKADINTAICAMLLSEQQTKPLICTDYRQFGYACNAENTVWIYLFTD